MYGARRALRDRAAEFEDLVDGIRELETMLANPVDKDDLEPFARDEAGVREVGRQRCARSPPARRSRRDMVAAKKPGTGIPARMLPEVLGRTARVDIAADTVLTEDLLA